MDTETCPKCYRKFKTNPDNGIATIVTEAYIDGEWIRLCPLCYSESVKQIHGIKWNPKGEIASAMFEEAKRQYPKWRQK